MQTRACLLLIGLSIASAACDRTGGADGDVLGSAKAKGPSSAEVIRAPSVIDVGDPVVARWRGKSFYEGTVKKLGPRRVTVEWSDGTTPSEVDRVDVMRPPPIGAKADFDEGDLVLAKWTGTTLHGWYGAEVTKVDGGAVTVRYFSDGTTDNLDPSKVLRPPAPIVADLRDQKKNAEMREEASQKGTPRRPAGYQPKPEEHVLAMWLGLGWYTGEVTEVTPEKVSVTWDDGSGKGEVPVDEVVPLPKPGAPLPDKGQLVLVQPETESDMWPYGRIQSVNGDTASVEIASGKTLTRKSHQLLPLE